jgi:hypothetical protein
MIDKLVLAASLGFVAGDILKQAGEDDVTLGSIFTANLEGNYAFTDIVSVGLGGGIKAVGNITGDTRIEDMKTGDFAANLGVNVGLNIGAAYFGAGLAVKDIAHTLNNGKDCNKPVIAIPLVFNFGL